MTKIGLLLAGAGALGCALGAALDPRHTLFAWLAAFASALSAVLAALVLVMVLHVVRARWWLVLRPVLMRVVGTLPAFVVLFLPIAIGRSELHPALFASHQRAWASAPFFFARAAVYFGAWLTLRALLGRADEINERAPTSERPERFEAQRRVSGAGLPVLAFTIHFAAVDWLMAIVPGWTSTAFGLYVFVGGLVAAIALLAVLRGPDVGPPHVHAIGRLLLMAVILWAYIAFFHLLLIWIADIPRESAFYAARARGPFAGMSAVLVLGHFVLPFFLLLSRSFKRSAVALSLLGGFLLVMHAVDLAWLVLPQVGDVRVLDAAPFLFVYGALVAFAARKGRRVERPVVDPVLRDALGYRSP